MKLSWGTRIFFLYTGFVAMIVFFVFKAMSQDIDLVAPDYYAQELKYQDKLDRINRANALAQPLTWKIENGSVKMTFPAEFNGKTIKGDIVFFRPSDKTKDVIVAVDPGAAGEQVISSEKLSSGLYRVQVGWEVDGVTYFKEGVVVIN